uniref:Ig-like domain-containing protein n=1 Tax=Romanomermis culicivorax TaxID=13658 RepID=A0A915IGY8_ROMCU
KPQLHVVVDGGTASPPLHGSFHLTCNVENVDDLILRYKWYKDGIIIDHIESRIYDVYDASMDDTGNYSCEIEYSDRVFNSSELQITVQECDEKVPDSINLFILIDTHGKYRQHLNRYQNFSFNIAKILDESYDSTVKVNLGVAIFDHQYERLMKFGKYGPVTGLNKRLLDQKIAKIMALNDSNIHLINMADAIEKSVAEFEEDQV